MTETVNKTIQIGDKPITYTAPVSKAPLALRPIGETRQMVLDYLIQARRAVTVTELVAEFNVSRTTIRWHLKHLSEENKAHMWSRGPRNTEKWRAGAEPRGRKRNLGPRDDQGKFVAPSNAVEVVRHQPTPAPQTIEMPLTGTGQWELAGPGFKLSMTVLPKGKVLCNRREVMGLVETVLAR